MYAGRLANSQAECAAPVWEGLAYQLIDRRRSAQDERPFLWKDLLSVPLGDPASVEEDGGIGSDVPGEAVNTRAPSGFDRAIARGSGSLKRTWSNIR